ncbi:thermonuclease family protein [Qipengyuania sp. 1XM1-15A]|uniref:thermonuclease family protein n=1 Tax=Qipengyuania xiamenensis TaxID=2867237 RepID=UPI001C888CA4|nr:thermonuclease family protein [Qipengyuania xiamenensis]MBX7532035.1 thermonuclease family protein [Qipengyuania xiamenensis]
MKTKRPKVVKFGKPKRDLSAPLVLGGAVALGIGAAFLWSVIETDSAALATEAEPITLMGHGTAEEAAAAEATSDLFNSDPEQPYLQLCEDSRRFNCVVDGDTLWLNGKKIRVADIDTPEVSSPQCDYEYDLGMRATYRFRDLLNEGPFSVEGIGDRDTDRFGRQLRVITRKGQSIGDMLVSEGLARTWTGRREPWC